MTHVWIVVAASMFVLGMPVDQGKDLLAELATAEASWKAQKARSYEFTIGVGCFCPPSPPPTFRVTDGQATPVGDVPSDVLRRYEDYNTIEKLFAELRDVAKTSPDKMVVTYDAKLGHPIRADVDPRKAAMDDQFTFNVTNVKILERGSEAQVPQRAGGPGPSLMQAAPKPLIANAKPVRSCESLASLALPDTIIESAAVDANNPDLCRIVAVTTHPPAGDKVRIWIAIPTANWNGRFLGTGGGGYSGGNANGVNAPAALGFAAGATDTGHTGGSASFALDAKGKLDWQAIRNFAHVGIHEMTVTGQALTHAMYGVAPRYSYFNGCSTGGRQGLMEAQRYPQDYHGIAAAAPAINWTNLLMQSFWGSMLMNAASNPIPSCKLAAATTAAVAACDGIDGVKDGVLEDPRRCTFDPKALIGVPAGECGAMTQADADIIRKLWEGPRRLDGSPLWYGPMRGTDLNALAPSRGTPLQPQAFGFSLDWLRYFITEDPQFDWTTVTPAGYQALWERSYEQYGSVIGTDNADLSAFRRRGGKTIIWHGLADQLITAEGTIDYYTRVQQRMGGAIDMAVFARLFLAPGVGHCSGGPGPQPTGVLDALLAWVEDGKAPETLTATRRDQTGAVTRSRPLCQYPLVAKYRGTGSTDDARNFVCSTGF